MSRRLEQALRAARDLSGRLEAELSSLDETAAARRALAALAERDLLAWNVPAAFGGADTDGLCAAETVSVRALCALRRELARGHGLLDVMFVMQGLGSFALALAGDARQRGAVLADVARGRRVPAFALTEPGAGSDLSAVATRAQRTKQGWRVSGHKTFISNAGIADLYTLLARTSGEPGQDGGLSMFLVPGDARGLVAKRFEVMAPHPIGDVLCEGVELPADALLGREGQGLEIALGVLARFRTSVAAAATGFAARALAESIRHLSTRIQFGKPLAANQALRFDVAEMDVRLAAAEALVRDAAQACDLGRPAAVEVARAKLYATEAASWICDRAVQHQGGLGVKRGATVERLYREVRALRIYEGTSEVQKLILSKEVLARGAGG